MKLLSPSRWWKKNTSDNDDAYLPDQYPLVYAVFCKSSIIKMLQQTDGPQGILIPPFLRALDYQPTKKQIAENMLAYWPIFLHNSMVYGVIPLLDEQLVILNDFEKQIEKSDNPWFDILLSSTNAGIQVDQFIGNLEQKQQIHLNLTRPLFESEVEDFRSAMLLHFGFDTVKEAYLPYL